MDRAAGPAQNYPYRSDETREFPSPLLEKLPQQGASLGQTWQQAAEAAQAAPATTVPEEVPEEVPGEELPSRPPVAVGAGAAEQTGLVSTTRSIPDRARAIIEGRDPVEGGPSDEKLLRELRQLLRSQRKQSRQVRRAGERK